jgi:hypothetical protein
MFNSYFRLAFAFTCAAAFRPLAASAARGVGANQVRLLAKAPEPSVVSGAGPAVCVIILNRSGLPLYLTQPCPARLVFRFLAEGNAADRRHPAATAFGNRWGPRRALVGIGPPTPIRRVKPGAALPYQTVSGQAIPSGRYVDLTLPGSYRLRVLTSRRIRRYGPGQMPINFTPTRVGPHLFLFATGGGPPTGGRPLYRALSNWTKVKILPPYGRAPAAALIAAGASKLAAPAARGFAILLADPDVKGPGPITVRAFLEYNGHGPMALRLTGDPQLDFRAVEVHEPGGYARGTRVQLPKPHWVFPKLPPPLTAYGKWLLKHPPKKLPEKNYTLKPGVVYKYTVPINLSCQYDMSRSGTYRVRVELAHPNIWSNWIKVKVPY